MLQLLQLSAQVSGECREPEEEHWHLAMVRNIGWRVLTSSRANDEERNDNGSNLHNDDFQKRYCGCYCSTNVVRNDEGTTGKEMTLNVLRS